MAAFQKYTKRQLTKLPNRVIEIGSYAFYNANIESIYT